MAKTSKQRSVRPNKSQSGCMWGLISMFDFRHARNTKRLLSDRKRNSSNNIHGSPYPIPEENMSTNSETMHLNIENGGLIKNPSIDLIKELIEEEMFVDQDPRNQNDTKRVESEFNKTLKKSFDHETSNNHQVSAYKTSQYQDLEALVKEIVHVYQKKNEQQYGGNLDTGAKRSFPIAEEKVFAAVEVLLNEKSNNGDHKKIHKSKEMCQMLNSNKEMFLKLLQDQNSKLLNEDHKSKSTEREPEDPTTHKHRKFFRRRSKSHDNISLNEKDKIVILKPASPENQLPTGHENGSPHFSFIEIKRRLKNAMGKEQRTLPQSEKTGKMILDGGWSSPNRDHFYTERFAKISNGLMKDRVSKLGEFDTKNIDTNHRISNIYVEAKKHLSEMLTSGDEDADLMMRSLPKSLGRILSLREYNSLSPGTSPKAQARHSFHEDIHMVNKSQPSMNNDNLEEKVVVPDVTTSEGVQEIIKSPSCDKKEHEEQTESFDIICEPCDSSNGVNNNQDEEIINVFNEEKSPESLKTDLREENELLSSQTHVEASIVCKTEELEISPIDKIEKPSPVSVLEPLFSDDDISPARTVFRPVEVAVKPLRIQFEESVPQSETHQIRITDSAENEESAFEYVEAVLLSSDLNWLDFETRWISSIQILDPNLFEDVESFSSRPRYDQKLLFDSANESLEDVCNRYIPESSFIKQSVHPIPKGMDLINEVWRKIDSCLCKAYPRDLGKLVRYDLESSRNWMDLRSVSRELVVKIEESIFEEAVIDTVLSLFDDCGDGDFDVEILDDRINNELSCL